MLRMHVNSALTQLTADLHSSGGSYPGQWQLEQLLGCFTNRTAPFIWRTSSRLQSAVREGLCSLGWDVDRNTRFENMRHELVPANVVAVLQNLIASIDGVQQQQAGHGKPNQYRLLGQSRSPGL